MSWMVEKRERERERFVQLRRESGSASRIP